MNEILRCAYQGYSGLTNSGPENLDVVVHMALATGSFGIGLGCYVAGQALQPAIRIFREIKPLCKENEPLAKGFEENQNFLNSLAKTAILFTILNVAIVTYRLNKIGCSHS